MSKSNYLTRKTTHYKKPTRNANASMNTSDQLRTLMENFGPSVNVKDFEEFQEIELQDFRNNYKDSYTTFKGKRR